MAHDVTWAGVRRTDEEAVAMSDMTTCVGQRLSLPILPTLDGIPMDLQTLRGEKVLLFMWASW
jgi:hypothetical protein